MSEVLKIFTSFLEFFIHIHFEIYLKFFKISYSIFSKDNL